MMLALLVLGAYVGFTHIQQKQSLWVNQNHLSTIEEQITTINARVDANRVAVGLVALLHNENFAAMRPLAQNRDILFINRDWTIDRLPKYLTLTKRDIELITKCYVRSKEVKKEQQSVLSAVDSPAIAD